MPKFWRQTNPKGAWEAYANQDDVVVRCRLVTLELNDNAQHSFKSYLISSYCKYVLTWIQSLEIEKFNVTLWDL